MSESPQRADRRGLIGGFRHLQSRRPLQTMHTWMIKPGRQKGPLLGPFVLKPRSLGQPGLDSIGAVFRFPFVQGFVVATFGFDDFARFRIFVNLHLAWFTSSGLGLGCWCATTSLRVEQIDYVFQAVAVLGQQSTQLGFKFNASLQPRITLYRFQRGPFGEVFFSSWRNSAGLDIVDLE